MRIQIAKGTSNDRIEIVRDDGSRVSTTFPKKGWFPHDAIHYVVERQLKFDNGFWGHVAAGHTPEEIGAIAKQGGHASASRASEPQIAIVELIQTERIVECFEAELWSAPVSFKTFMEVLSAACGQSQIPIPKLTEADVQLIRRQLAELGATWRELPTGRKLELNWP